MGPYVYLNSARNSLHLDIHDSNLIAAERYMEGYEDNYGDIFLLGQHVLKQVRRLPGASNILGKNGAPPSESWFITQWGMLGNYDRRNELPIRGTDCDCK